MVHSLIGVDGGLESSKLESRIITRGADFKICSRLCLALRIGPSGRSILFSYLSISPIKCIFGTLKSQEMEEVFARIVKSAVQPKDWSQDKILTLFRLKLGEILMFIFWIRVEISSIHAGPILE